MELPPKYDKNGDLILTGDSDKDFINLFYTKYQNFKILDAFSNMFDDEDMEKYHEIKKWLSNNIHRYLALIKAL